jgi:hypothetical protein
VIGCFHNKLVHCLQKVRFFLRWNLIFSFCLTACSEQQGTVEGITIISSNGKAQGIFVPRKLIPATSADSVAQLLHIHLAQNKTAILGEYKERENGIEFHPVIALTPGLKYEVYWAEKFIGEVTVPTSKDAPSVIAVYPGSDTVPENLLKFYIRFSKPMQQGEALDHIRLVKNNEDTLSAVFLDLQPELWNNEGNMLTLWLDPGRIKRGLQPNKILGPPLQSNEHYSLLILPGWRDANGVSLTGPYHKNFYTSTRDSNSPDPNNWSIREPAAGTLQSITIRFTEPLDYVLLQNTMRIVDEKNGEVKGAFEVSNHETELTFVPAQAWERGSFVLEIEPRLEDLAGNNLNHLFDSDLDQQHAASKTVFQKTFHTN